MAANLKTEITLTDKNFSSQLDSLCKKAQNSLNNTSRVSQNLGNVLGGFGPILTKVAGTFGVAKAAGDLFNKMQANCQSLGDAVVRAETQAGASVNYFASCLARADFSNFISGLNMVMKRAGDLADTLDELATKSIELGLIDARDAVERSKAMTRYYKARTKQEKKQALEQIRVIDERNAKEHREVGKLNKEAAIQTLMTAVPGISRKQVEDYFNNPSKYRELGQSVGRDYNRARGTFQSLSAKANSGHSMSDKDVQNWDKARKDAERISKSSDFQYYKLSEVQDKDEDSPVTQAFKYMTDYYRQEGVIASREEQRARKEARLEGSGGSGGGSGKGGSTGGGSGKNTPPPRDYQDFSPEYYDKLLSYYRSELSKVEIGSESWNNLQKNIRDTELELNLKLNGEKTQGWYDAQIEYLRSELSSLPIGSDSWKEVKKQLEDVEIELNFQLNKEKFSKSIEGLTATGDLSKHFQLTIPPIEGLEGVKGLKTSYELAQEAMMNGKKAAIENSQAFSELGRSFGSLGNAIGGTAGTFIGAIGDIASTIASAIGSIIALTVAKNASSAMDLPFPANIAALATGIAALASVIMTIKSAMSGKYAQGGIVGGGSYVGDKRIAFVNSGEMILNRGQQGRLWSIVNGNSTIGDSNPGTSDVHFVLRGSDLYGSINNYKRLSKK